MVVLFYVAGLFTETPANIQGPGGFNELKVSESGFLVTDLTIEPEVARPNETVTITVSATNTHDTWGIYSLVLQISGVREAQS